jgi:hypothetical protein
MALLAKLAGTVDRFTELANDLLGTLRAETGIASFRPLLPALFAGPLQMATSYPVVSLYQITPQPRGLLACRAQRAPLRGGMWQPMYFYRAIAHEKKIT